MAISTYAELQDAILAWVNKQDIEQSLESIIDLTEADIGRRLRHWRMEKRSTSVLDTQYSALPSDFLEPIRLQVTDTGTTRLEPISLSEMMDRRDLANDTAGRPYYYAIIDGAIEVFPTPNDDYTLEMVYYSSITPLSDANTSNWLLTRHPDVYLYGSLVHSAGFIGDDARMGTWSAMYQSALDGVTMDDNKAKYGGTGLRMKVRSY